MSILTLPCHPISIPSGALPGCRVQGQSQVLGLISWRSGRRENIQSAGNGQPAEVYCSDQALVLQIYIDDVTGETMPVWFPPTPPQDDNDIYIDPIARLLYLPGPMPEDQLPVIHVKRERKRTKTESDSPGGVLSQKRRLSRVDIHAPRSLFNRPHSQLKKRELKPPKYRPQLKKASSILPQAKALTLPTLPNLPLSADKENITASVEQQGLPTVSTSASASTDTHTTDARSNKNLDWLINEDWKLLQAVQQVLEMPLSLAVLMPAHTPNWDLVADIVNSVSSVYRSPKMCKQRFENVIAPREEGRSAMEIPRDIKKKIKGTKTPTKLKFTKPQKTTNMHSGDNNAQHSGMYSNRFDAIKETCSKRTMPLKTSSSAQFQRNPKHTSILMDNGITYDKPLPPVQVASLRADRIAREKAMEVAKQQQQQLVQSHSIQSPLSNMQQVSKPGLSTLGVGQLTAIPLSGSASNIIVNSSALSAITKKINQHTVSKTSLGNTALQQTLLRTVSASDQSQQMQPHQQQIQIQQPGQIGTMVTVGLLHRLSSPGTTTSVTTTFASNSTIPLSSLTRPSISVPTGAVIQQGSQQIPKQLTKQQQQRLQQQMQIQLQKQQKKPVKAQLTTPRKLQITPEAMKKLTLQRQQQQQQLDVVAVPKVAGKQRKTTSITQQELEQLLLKNPSMRRQIQKQQTSQVQIAPVHAQVQAQQVQEAAAQQAAQHILTSKPLPITVPVSNLVSVAAVNLGGMNMSISSSGAGTSGQGKQLIMTGQQVPVSIQQQLQRQLLKQRMVTQQQAQLQTQQQVQAQSKVGVKQTVYAMVAGAPLVTQGKRRVNVATSSTGQVVTGQQPQPGMQQPVQLTVTKLLQSPAIPGQPSAQLKQPMTQQSADAMTQQILQQQSAAQQQLQVASATIVPSSNVAQQRLITSQRQIRQIQQMATMQQPTQMILTPASSQQFLQRPNQNVVASISIGAASTTASTQQQMTLSSSAQQTTNLSQQLQNLLTPQVLRAQTQAGITAQTMRPAGQQHHLVLSQVGQQQTLAMTPQMAMTSPTTMTLAPSLVHLPASAVSPAVGSQSQPLAAQPQTLDGSGRLQQKPTLTNVQYVTRTMPPQ